MYVIEITEDKLQSMAEHVEKGLRHMGKLMQCIEELEEDFSDLVLMVRKVAWV